MSVEKKNFLGISVKLRNYIMTSTPEEVAELIAFGQLMNDPLMKKLLKELQ